MRSACAGLSFCAGHPRNGVWLAASRSSPAAVNRGIATGGSPCRPEAQRRACRTGDGASPRGTCRSPRYRAAGGHDGAVCGPGWTRTAPHSDAFHTGTDPSRTNMAKPSIASGRSKSLTSCTARPRMQAESGASATGDRLSSENITPDRPRRSASGRAPILRHRQCHRAQASGRSG